ncbi:DUF4271 domain-containing protein [Sphingobacterium haloxyli]|uniref:DUF4271 domain-containing protein n=1 Tax=Sphingobacterium haloxyli TaxID=2100533 RepID=A0A2S9J0Y8_9SPHI|nr:DUF4271 domain-containing protein [Sphingobacterium haloxyli]PRD46429.1 DUF4271 domain-containing protein [Sphingobacterium haloxyli]
MYLLKRIFLSSLLCLIISTAGGNSVERTEIDTFNYILPAEDRPNKLLEQLSIEIRQRSIDPVTSLDYMKSMAEPTESIPYGQGERKSERPVWVLLVVFMLFLAIALVRLAFPGDFTMIVQAYYDERSLLQMSKEDNMLTSWPYIFLYFIFSLALGLFIVLMESSFVRFNVLNFENYVQTAFLVAILFIIKILLIRFISFVFEIGRLVREYVTVLYLVYFNSMLFLMPFLLAVALVPTTYFKILLILFSILVSILFIYRFLRAAFRLFGNLKFSIFYLILYLCALEVAPILILVRTLSN